MDGTVAPHSSRLTLQGGWVGSLCDCSETFDNERGSELDSQLATVVLYVVA